MAIAPLTDAIIYFNSRALQGKSNQVSAQASVDMLDATVFGNGTKVNLAGLKSWTFNVSGFWDAGTDVEATGVQFVDSVHADALNNRIGASAGVMTIAPVNVDLGVSYFCKEVEASYKIFGALGQTIPFSLDAMTASYVTQGVIGLPPVQKVAAGNGTVKQLAALSSTQKLVAAMHVVQFNGTTMTMKVQSDNAVGFPSSADVITFTAATGNTSEWKEASGPITDDYFRTSWTFTGTSFTAIVSFGIYTPV